MARATRDSSLESPAARQKLRKGVRHWRGVGKGLALGYRRTTDGYGTWSYRVLLPDGRYKIKTIGVADGAQDSNGVDLLSYFEAQAKCRKVAEGEKERAGLLKEPLTVSKAAEQYLEWFKVNRRSHRYTEGRIRLHILPKFGDRLVSELTTPELRQWRDHLASQKPYKRATKGKQAQGEIAGTPDAIRARRATANRVLMIFKALLNKAFNDELVTEDRAWRVVTPFKKVDQVAIRFLAEKDAIRLINCCDGDFRPLVKAALFTGGRYGELTALHVSDVHLAQRRVYFHGSKTGDGRYVPLSADGVDLFKSQIVGKTGSDLVFTREDDGAWGTAHQTRRMLSASARAKIKPAATFYDLRHTYASLLKHSGADLMYVSKLLGHADMRMTLKHYAGMFDDTLEKTIQAHLPSFGHKPSGKVKARVVQIGTIKT